MNIIVIILFLCADICISDTYAILSNKYNLFELKQEFPPVLGNAPLSSSATQSQSRTIFPTTFTTGSPSTRPCIAKTPLLRPWPQTYCMHGDADTPDSMRPNSTVTFTCEYEHIGDLTPDMATWVTRFTRASGLLNHWSFEGCALYNDTLMEEREWTAGARDGTQKTFADNDDRSRRELIHPIETASLCTRAFLLTHMRLNNWFSKMNLEDPCPRARPIEYIWIYNVSLANKSSWSTWLQSYFDAGGTLVPGRYSLVSISLADDFLDGLDTLLQLLARSPHNRPFELTLERMPRLEQVLTQIEQHGNQVQLNLTGLHMQASDLRRIPHAFKAHVRDLVDLSNHRISKLKLNDLAFLTLANDTEIHLEDGLLCHIELQEILRALTTGGRGARVFLARNPVSDLGGLAQAGLSDPISAADILWYALNRTVVDCCSSFSSTRPLSAASACTVSGRSTVPPATLRPTEPNAPQVWVIVVASVGGVVVALIAVLTICALLIYLIFIRNKTNKRNNEIIDDAHELKST